MRYHYIPIGIAKMKTMTIPNAGEDSEELDLSSFVGGNVKCYSHCSPEYLSQISKNLFPYKTFYTNFYCCLISFIIPKLETIKMSFNEWMNVQTY